LQLPGLELSGWEHGYSNAKVDVMLSLVPGKEGLRGSLVYAADVFAAERMERMVEHLVTMLERAVREPETGLWAIPMLSAGERRKVVEEWNRTEEEVPGLSVHELFEEQARRTPEKVAVVSGRSG